MGTDDTDGTRRCRIVGERGEEHWKLRSNPGAVNFGSPQVSVPIRAHPWSIQLHSCG